ncbi:MAG: DUF4838 domain-containing protein, partial [Victivallales bacterium]|nr:DUF4838 domain-containing protein [Victivallales bacterium]
GDLTIGGNKSVTFHVGDTQLAKSQGLTSTKLPDEKWVVKSFGDDVLVNGGGLHGALYATYHFLEDCCDIHWWSDYEEYVPPASPLELPALDMSGKPYFRYRNIHRGAGGSDLPLTAIRNRLNANGARGKIGMELGGSVRYGSPDWTHTHCRYITKSEFFDDHPEYFALRNGKRTPGESGQLCLSNPDLPAIFAEKLCKYIEQDRAESAKSGVPYPIYYDISMNDNRNPCTCEKCAEYAKNYNYSTQLIEFLNEISKLVAPKYPDIYISSLAYFYNDTPPKKDIKTEKNIVIRLCDTTTNQALSILHPDNAEFNSYVREWKRHTDNLSIWDYAIAYYQASAAYPFAGEFYYGDLYKFYRDNNVTEIFWEHELEYWADMFEYKFFLECKLMEDPDADLAKLQDIFLTRYYGAAAPFVMEYRRMLDRDCRENKGKVPFAWPVRYYEFSFIRDLRRYEALFDEAEAAVKGDELLIARLRRARIGIALYAMQSRGRLHWHGEKGAKEADDGLDYAAMTALISNDWHKWAKKYPGWKRFVGQIDSVVSAMEVRCDDKPFKFPEQFKDRRFYYFRPEAFLLFDGDMKLVDDAESPTGKAARVNGKAKHYYEMPYEMGCYDLNFKKTNPWFKMADVSDKHGYNWYKMGRVTVKPRNDLFFNRSWTIQIPISYPETLGRTFDVWASIKFTGPMYHPDEKDGESFIWQDLVILEDVNGAAK